MKNKITIYKANDSFYDVADIDLDCCLKSEVIKCYQDVIEVDVDNSENDTNIECYIKSSEVENPSWIQDFFCSVASHEDNKDTWGNLLNSNSSALLIVKLKIDTEILVFFVTHGYARNMIKSEVIDNRFGIKVLANAVSYDQIRRVSKKELGGHNKYVSEQLPQTSTIRNFNIDFEKDLVSELHARVDSEGLESELRAAEGITISHEVDIKNIGEFIRTIFNIYKRDIYKNHFEWIDNITPLRNNELENVLDDKLLDDINDCPNKIVLSVPELLDFEILDGFTVGSKGKNASVFPNLSFEMISQLKNNVDDINIKMLKEKYIYALNGGTAVKSWNIFRCLNYEGNHNGVNYVLSNGNWYTIDNDFAEKIERNYSNIQLNFTDFIDSNYGESEGEYNIRLCNALGDQYLLMDKKNISYGGGSNKIELCDVLGKNNKFIHIKKTGSSSTLSHLFYQAINSHELVLNDRDFVDKTSLLIKKEVNGNDFGFKKGTSEIVLGIIDNNILDDQNQAPIIPFFSKVSINNVVKEITSKGSNVSLKRIRLVSHASIEFDEIEIKVQSRKSQKLSFIEPYLIDSLNLLIDKNQNDIKNTFDFSNVSGLTISNINFKETGNHDLKFKYKIEDDMTIPARITIKIINE